MRASFHRKRMRESGPFGLSFEAEMDVLPAVEGGGLAVEEEVMDLEFGLAAALLAGKPLSEQARYFLRASHFSLRLDEQQSYGSAPGCFLHRGYAGNESLPIGPEKSQETVGGLSEGGSSSPERPAAPTIMPASAMNMASASGAK